jgi:hypothetical protein
MAENTGTGESGVTNTPDAHAVLDVLKKPKLTVKDLGNPKLVTSDNPKLILGKILGTATGTKEKVDNKGEVFIAIVGSFEGIRGEDGQRIQSGVLYLPSGFHDEIVAQLKSPDVSDVVFAFEVMAHTASNAIGYSYAMRNLLPAMPDDPLERVRALMAERVAQKLAQIEAQKLAQIEASKAKQIGQDKPATEGDKPDHTGSRKPKAA